MAIDPAALKSLIEGELESLSDARVLAHIREMLIEPEVVFRAWDYGKHGEKYPCWTVLWHAASKTGIAYCEYGFGPRCPWGLVGLEDDETQGSIGMDSGWFTSLLAAYFDSHAASELPIWCVIKETSSWPGEPLTGEDLGRLHGNVSSSIERKIPPRDITFTIASLTNPARDYSRVAIQQ